MGERFYRQIGEANNLKTVAEIMEFCTKPIAARDKRTKAEIAESILVPNAVSLVKTELVWLEDNISHIKGTYISGSSKKDVVAELSKLYPEVSWNKLTLNTIKEVLNV